MQRNEYLFEMSWEVCNKVGGIYTVITSKLFEVKKYFKNYFLIGPYFDKNYLGEFKENEIPEEFKEGVLELENLGIKLHFGEWIKYNHQKTILVEYLGFSQNINSIKAKLWEKYNIDSLNSNWYDFDEAILWSWCSGIAIEKLTKNLKEDGEDVLVHAHEWMSGGSIFYLKQIENNSKFKTVFTTHATMLGRTICSSNENLYGELESIDPNLKSYELGVHTKHQSEKALANISDCFTTVSEITGDEAMNFYDKKVDVLLPNGFDSKIDEKNGTYKMFMDSRDFINDFLRSYSKGFYDLDLDNSMIFYTSGRNEFKDKGVDIYIKALSKLNETLKNEEGSREIINLFLIPIGNFEKATNIANVNILPFSTHSIPCDNQIIKAFLDNGLLNRREDKVKNIVFPFYISMNDGIFNKGYYEVISGLDLGIFVSYYEPWGYTPLESISFSVPTITSNLSGFGRYCKEHFENHPGIGIVNRTIDDRSVDELYEKLLEFSKKKPFEIESLKIESLILSSNFSWDIFYENYLKAYEFARSKK